MNKYISLALEPLRYIRHIGYTIKRKIFVPEYTKLKILSDEETIKEIIENKKSISRFGDGEIHVIYGTIKNSFQDNSEELAKKLKETISSDLDNLLICLPNTYTSLDMYCYTSQKYWERFLPSNWEQLKGLIDINKTYGTANLTRPYMPYNKKYRKQAGKKFEMLKKIWQDKELVIIEGELTKLGVGNDLFDNAKSIERIIAPSTNAFSKYNEIYSNAIKLNKNKLILIALGQTATVLSYDLAKAGYQALDIGHIDIEYEWYLRKASKKIPIKGKYVNEVKDKSMISLEIEDPKYKDSIIKIIK